MIDDDDYVAVGGMRIGRGIRMHYTLVMFANDANKYTLCSVVPSPSNAILNLSVFNLKDNIQQSRNKWFSHKKRTEQHPTPRQTWECRTKGRI
jgi:hypothetical protein